MLAFLFTAIAISLSGVMAPGPITAATLVAGSRARHAGAMIALGHAVVEVPLILLLVAGLGTLLESPTVRTAIGFAGGIFLIWMGGQLLLSLRAAEIASSRDVRHQPFVTGIVLTGANPYFLVWWATVGLALASDALAFGIGALVLFTIVHWLCDLGWLEVLSLAGHKGTERFGDTSQKAISALCGSVLVGFGAKFLYDAGLSRWATL